MLSALEFHLDNVREIAIVGPTKETVQQILTEIHNNFLPNKILACRIGDMPLSSIPWLRDKVEMEGKPTVYICESFTCKPPVTTISELRRMLA